MLYKFKSHATSDLIMLEPNGRQVLQIIGKSPDPTGIIRPEQVPAALQALDAALAAEDAKGRKPDADDAEDGDDGKKGPGVSLRQRIAPFADMLRQAAAENADVTWGV